ncbi:platelet binding protein GspB-like [Homarus americanus]|uniref:platelet binding protein GspB-like n=1 Tax=Homarus americanus TaxID=6706 RepID=UPI001C47CED0|nr:platelet binding protein GspB-like [Homarus americanus]
MDTRKRRKEGAALAPSLESLQVSPKRARVHAQRKFAQGSQPNSPAPTPVKETRELRDRSGSSETRSRSANQVHPPPPPLDIVEVPVRPTVEDFLTFLCYRGTALLPPGLEHFNSPQLLEAAGDSRSQSPARDDKGKLSSKKKQDGFTVDKRELSKETVKKNLDQSTDGEGSCSVPFRVTRSTPHPPLTASNSPPMPHSAKKLSKRLMMKKALLLQTKAKSLRIQERKNVALRRSDIQAIDSTPIQGPIVATRSGRLLHKYRVSATTAIARKKARVAMLSSIRPKQKLSRILQRLGSSVSNQDSRLTRMTRSQAEVKHDGTEDKTVEEEQKEKLMEKNEKRDIGKIGKSEDLSQESSRVSRPVRLVRQKLSVKKIVVKKVVRVTREATKYTDVESSSSASVCQPLLTQSPDQVPLAKRLRRSTQDPTVFPVLPKKCPASPIPPSPTVSHTPKKSCPSDTSTNAPELEEKSVSNIPGLEIVTDPSPQLDPSKDTSPSLGNSQSLQQKSHPNSVTTTPVVSHNQNKKPTLVSIPVSATPKKSSPQLSPSSPSTSRKSIIAKEDKQNKDTSAAVSPDSPVTSTTTEETEGNHGIRTRPSRRTKEAATVYLQLIGRKLAQESKGNVRAVDEEDEDEENNTPSVKNGIDLKAQTKIKGKGEEIDGKKNLNSSTEEETSVSMNNTGNAGTEYSVWNDSLAKPGVRKSLRKSRDSSGQADSEKVIISETPNSDNGRVSKRTPSFKDESSNSAGDEKVTCSLRRTRRCEKRDSSTPEQQESSGHTNSPPSLGKHSQTTPFVTSFTKVEPRRLRRTRSDADEPKKKGSRPSFRRASLETDSSPEVARQRRITRGRDGQDYKENESDSEESDRLIMNTRTKRDIKRTVNISSDQITHIRNVSGDENEKCLKVRTRRLGGETPSGNKSDSSLDNSKIKDSKTSGIASDFIHKVENKGECQKSDSKLECNKDNKESEQQIKDENKDDNGGLIVAKESNTSVGNGVEISDKTFGPAGKSRRTVSQERKTEQYVRHSSLRKSLEKSDSNDSIDTVEVLSRSSSRSRSGSLGSSIENTNLEMYDKKSLGPGIRRKSVGSRRRSSNHDEAKLNEVLESVAKDFERDIDDDHYDKIEKDFMMGNKSPEKNKGERTPTEIEKEDLFMSDSSISCMDEKSSSSTDMMLTSSVSLKMTGGGGAVQSGCSSPSPNKRSTTSKKLSDVVRSLQKKQAETPSTVTPSVKPTFLKDLSNWNSDKSRQVSPQSGPHLQSTGTSSAPIAVSQSDASLPEIAHSPSAPSIPLENTATTTSKAPSPTPQKSGTTKVASTRTGTNRLPPTNSPVATHSSPQVEPVMTTCSQTLAPSTAVTPNFHKSLSIVNTAPAGTSAFASGIQKGNVAPSKTTPFIFQSGQDEHVTVLPSLPVTVKPPATINVVSTGFSSPLTVSRVPQLSSVVTLSPVGCGSVASPKPIEPSSTKSTPKQLSIAPKPATTSTALVASAPAGQVSISVLPPGTQKPPNKPVQIAPKPPATTPHIHPNTQLLAPQPGHMMQAQVQAQVQTIPQPLHTVQAITQPVQTMQAIPQPIQTVQTVTGMPVQAVITQAVIDPTQLVTPSSPAKIITQPVFVTSSMQSAVTYSIAPQTVGQGHLTGNVGALARVLNPTMGGKVAAKPQPRLMTPKAPESLVTLAPATVGSTSSVRPIVPLSQQVQPSQQTQILAVMPVGSAHVQTLTGQPALMSKSQGPIPSSTPVHGNHHALIPTTANDQITTQTHATVPLSQSLLNTSATSQIPAAAVPTTFPVVSSEVTVNSSHLNTKALTGSQHVSVPVNQALKPVSGDKSMPGTTIPSGKLVGNIKPYPSIPSQATQQSANSGMIVAITKACSATPGGSVNKMISKASENKLDSSISTQTCKVVETAFRGGIPGNVRITEVAKVTNKNNGPVPITNLESSSKSISSSIPARPQLASSSVTITALTDSPHSSQYSVSEVHKVTTSSKQPNLCSNIDLKLSSSVSIVQHKSGFGRNVAVAALLSKTEIDKCTNMPVHIIEKEKSIVNHPTIRPEKEKQVSTTTVTSCNKSSVLKMDKDKIASTTSVAKSNQYNHPSTPALHKSDKTVTVSACNQSKIDKNKIDAANPGLINDVKSPEKMQTVNGKDESDSEKLCDKKIADKKKEPLLKRTLFKTKSQDEKKTPGPSPVYKTKSLEGKKPSGAFSPLHESSVYAFEPEVETSLEESSPFSQRIKNIQPSPGSSPVKPNNLIKPPPQGPATNKPLSKVASLASTVRSPVARSLTPMIVGKPKSIVGVSPSTVTPTVLVGKRTSCSTGTVSVKAAGTATETSQVTNKLISTCTTSQSVQEHGKVGAEAEVAVESTAGFKKNVSSTSIAIQCDMDEGMEAVTEDGVSANESGTQTEGPSKFPLPPNASPFYYLPLAMAALGEKLPAQLVQQMLAKTQGLVGAAEAGMILQQAAQIAQQHQQKLQQQGFPGPSPISNTCTSAVKPIKPANISGLAVTPIMAGNPTVTPISSVRPLNKNMDSSLSVAEISSPSPVVTTTPTANPVPSIIVTTSASSSTVSFPSVTSSSCIIINTPTIAVNTPVSASSTPATHKVAVTSNDIKSVNIPPHRTHLTPSITPSEEVNVSPTYKTTTKSRSVKSKAREDETQKISRDGKELPTRRRSGRATTLAATRATESDMHEIEELRRNRRAKRAAAALAKEEGWSSSSEAPLSPQMSPDTLRGWPPPRLTSPTPSQSSEGTTSSTPSQRGNRLSSSRSRRQSPASSIDSSVNPGKTSTSSSASIQASQVSTSNSAPVMSDKTLADPNATHICDNTLLTRAPTFFPSEEEFTDPLDYIEKIRPEAEQFGLCRIVPPNNFKPECRVNDDMRFTGNNQYIHKMMRRWGPNVRTLHAIKRCLAKQNIELNSNPLIGCMELDLVRLYEVVEQHGGLMSVIEKELWGKVADTCRIPRSAQERLAKLDFIYCKYLLPYATLSQEERGQLLAEVDSIHNRNQMEQSGGGSKKASSNSSDNDEEEEEESLDCIVKGKSTALSTFYRIARNTATQWQPDPAGLEVDERYWSLVVNGTHHVCVLSASIDTSEHGYGFPNHRLSPLAKHPWNLKNLCQNPNSILRSMGTIVGVTAPTLHVGMLFSTVCWYRDPHSLPWIEYLHTGASKIWYGVAASQEDKLCAALKKIVPDFVKDSAIWLPSDTAMVPPSELVREGVRVCRVVQDPGQFVVVFPGAFTSSLCKGYLISESAFFARPQYFERAIASFRALHECCEPSMFSLDRLVLSVVSDPRATLDGLLRARELALQVVEKEKRLRAQLAEIGLEASERLSTPDSHRKKKSRFIEDEEENMCEICRQNLYVSLVTNSQEEAVYCLDHALILLSKNPSHLEYCKLMYTYSLSELDSAIKQMDERIQLKSGKKTSPNSKRAKAREHHDSFSSTSSSNL